MRQLVTRRRTSAFLVRHTGGPMPLIRMLIEPGLLVHAQSALGVSQEKLGQRLGVSRRTITRWTNRSSHPSPQEWAALARLVHPKDRDLAAKIASALGESLLTLGIEAPPPPPPPQAPHPPPPPPRPFPPAGDLVDSVVCAAADAIGVTPRAVRPALMAAFDRYASLGLSLEEVRKELRAISQKDAKRPPENPESQRPQGR
jgi:DNA-binding XRE family transcriptional regulator